MLRGGEITGLDELEADLRDTDMRVRGAMLGAVNRGSKRLQKNIKNRIPNLSGRSRKSVRRSVSASELEAEVYTTSHILRFREHGTRSQHARPAFDPAAAEEEPAFVADMQQSISGALEE